MYYNLYIKKDGDKMKKYNMNYRELMKYCDAISEVKIKCGCGHSVIIPPHKSKVLCDWCKKYVFKTKKDEFEYRMKEMMHKQVENK